MGFQHLTAERRREIAAKGGRARASLPDFHEHQVRAGKARAADRTEMSRIGRLGYQATMSRYGREYVLERMASWRRRNPSCHEQAVAKALDKEGVEYEREVVLDRYVVDFVVGNTIIEVNGEVHDDPVVFGKSPEYEAKRLLDLESMGYRVLVIHWSDIVNFGYREALCGPVD
jgi:very-short-patch-repair endonuclease